MDAAQGAKKSDFYLIFLRIFVTGLVGWEAVWTQATS